MNLKSSASKSGFLDPNSASGDKSCFVRTISFSGSKGNLEFFIVSFSSKSPLSELTFGLKVIICHSDLYIIHFEDTISFDLCYLIKHFDIKFWVNT